MPRARRNIDERRRRWEVKAKGGEIRNPIFIIDQFRPHRSTMTEKSNAFLCLT